MDNNTKNLLDLFLLQTAHVITQAHEELQKDNIFTANVLVHAVALVLQIVADYFPEEGEK